MRLTPTPADKFTFGLWTVGNRGRDPFGEFVRPPLDPVRAVHRLAELGAWGVNFHDNDLVPDRRHGRRARSHRPRLPEGARRHRHDRADGHDEPVHRSGVQGRRVHVARRQRPRLRAAEDDARDGSRRGAGRAAPTCSGAAAKARRSMRRRIPSRRSSGSATRSTSCASTRAIRSTSCGSRSKPSRTSRAATSTSRRPPRISRSSPRSTTRTWSASTRRSRTSTWPGLNFYHVVAQAIEAGKLFHIDLNDQKPGRFDQDLRFASESIKPLFFLVKLLEESGYDGPRHFDAHAYRTEDEQGVWDFACGCMRTYLILKEKAAAVSCPRRDSGAALRDSRRGSWRRKARTVRSAHAS